MGTNSPTQISEGAENQVQLLMEGFDPLCVPSVICVKQGSKVCYTKGKPDMLHESIGDNLTIVESINDLDLQIDEKTGAKYVKDGKWIVEGIFQRSGSPKEKNANGRYYTRKLWERLISTDTSGIQESIRRRRAGGHNEHPGDGRTDLNKVSLVTTSAKLQEDGTVWGRAELLNTESGKNLQALTADGYEWGVSSRGSGLVGSDGKVDEDKFNLITWDAVASPSTPGAYPKPVKPAKQTNESVQPTELNEDSKQIVSAITETCETDIDESDRHSQNAVIKRLMKHFGQVGGMVKANAITGEDASALLHRLTDKLKQVHESNNDDVVKEIDTAIIEADLQDEARREAAFHRLSAGLRQELQEAQDTVADLQKQLHESRQEAARGASESRRMQQTVVKFQTQLHESTSQLATAQKVITESRPSDQKVAVQERIDDLIGLNPVLVKYRHALNESATVKGVDEIADTIVSLVEQDDRPARPSIAPAVRPVGNIISESAAAAQMPHNQSAGARMASAALRKMSSQSK
jgi:cytochrome c556